MVTHVVLSYAQSGEQTSRGLSEPLGHRQNSSTSSNLGSVKKRLFVNAERHLCDLWGGPKAPVPAESPEPGPKSLPPAICGTLTLTWG